MCGNLWNSKGLCWPDAEACFCFLASACPAGLYGKNCQHSCLCRNGGSCDPILGQCVCPEGWTGLACENGELSGLSGRRSSGQEDGLSRGGGQHARSDCSVFPSTQGAGRWGWCLLGKALVQKVRPSSLPSFCRVPSWTLWCWLSAQLQLP